MADYIEVRNRTPFDKSKLDKYKFKLTEGKNYPVINKRDLIGGVENSDFAISDDSGTFILCKWENCPSTGCNWEVAARVSGGPKLFENDEGKKFDEGKLRYDLIPPYSLEEVVKTFTLGIKKHGEKDWEKGRSWRSCFAKIMRHSWKWFSGEKYEPEFKLHHLACVIFQCLILIEYERKNIGTDDRPKEENNAITN